MATKRQSRSKILPMLHPVSVTSDGATSAYVDYNGFNRALIGCQGGLVATGDSDDTLSFQLYRVDDIAAASAAASDHVAVTAGVTALGPSASSDVQLGMEFIDLDLMAHTMDNGCLVLVATASEGGAIAGSAYIELYQANGTVSDTSMTIVTPASS